MKNTSFVLGLFVFLFSSGAFSQGFVAGPGTKITLDPSAILDIGSGNLVLNAAEQISTSLIDHGNITYSGGGTAQVDIYITEGRWHLISSPVAGEISEIFLGDYLEYHTESTNGWTDIAPVNVLLTPMKGYALWSVEGLPGTETFSGPTNTGQKQYHFTHYGLGWNLVGNPYPSVIDWDKVSIPAELSAAIWLFDPGIGLNGDYRYYIPGGGPANTTTPYIQPGQGFFVQATGAAGNLVFDNSIRVHTNSAFYKEGTDSPMLLLKVKGNGITTQTAVRFEEAASGEYDRLFDVNRIMPDSPDVPVLFTGTSASPMAINTLPGIEGNETIPLWFRSGTTGSYTISGLLTESFDASIPLWIEDVSVGYVQNLRTSTDYTFNYNEPGTDKSFLIYFKEPVRGNENNNIRIYSDGKVIRVIMPGAQYQGAVISADIIISDMMGREISKSRINTTMNEMTMDRVKPGYLIVTVITPLETVSEKVFIK